MAQVCIDRHIIGTEKHLLCNEGFSWVDDPPTDSWFLSADDADHTLSLNTLARLHGVSIDTSPPVHFKKAMHSLLSGSLAPVPWSHVMPRRSHRAFVNNLVNAAVVATNELPKEYYETAWRTAGLVLKSLKPAKVDVDAWDSLVAQNPPNMHVLQTFKPDKKGFSQKVSYDRFGTRTGRLTVKSGPGILTLKRDYRKQLLVSRYEGGCVISIDFAALEARVLLYEGGGRCDDPDMYSLIAKDVFGGSATRQQVKGAVISEVYGSSKSALGAALGIGGKDLDDFVSKVRNFFRISDLRKRVKEEYVKNGWITNRYGRRVQVDEPLDHILVNSYAQSTGVDVAMLGFHDIIQRMKKLSGVIPLYVLHDALLVDCPPEHIDAVMSEREAKVSGYVQKFFVKPEKLRCTPTP